MATIWEVYEVVLESGESHKHVVLPESKGDITAQAEAMFGPVSEINWYDPCDCGSFRCVDCDAYARLCGRFRNGWW